MKPQVQLGRAVFTGPALLPAGLELVLAPVRPVWERIVRSAARHHVQAAVRVQLGDLAGVLGHQEAAEALAERLGRRLDQQMGRPVTDPVGWILARGLPQRAWCWSQLCDEGRRMDTGGSCPSCQVLIGDSRGLRSRITAQTAKDLPGATPEALKAEVDKRLNAAVTYEHAVRADRRERILAEQQARATIVQQRRAEQEAAERQRLAQPCADCGLPQAAALCLLCTQRRSTARVLAEAVDLAVMGPTDLSNIPAVAVATERCTNDTRDLHEQALQRKREKGAGEADLLLAAREIAVAIRDGRRQALHTRLLHSPEAVAEGDKAYDAQLRSRRYATRALAEQAAERAADQAQLRTAECLLTQRTRQLHAARREEAHPTPALGWTARCADLAEQALAQAVSAA